MRRNRRTIVPAKPLPRPLPSGTHACALAYRRGDLGQRFVTEARCWECGRVAVEGSVIVA